MLCFTIEIGIRAVYNWDKTNVLRDDKVAL